jgi:hypothetical protein
MSEAPQYPSGIEYRQPRPRGTMAGAILGSLLGYALTQNSSGAVGGGTLGGILGNQPLPLHQAIRQKFTEKGLEVINFYRLGRFAAKILFRYQNVYWTLESHTSKTPEMTIEQIEDWLYGDLVEKVEGFLNKTNLRLRP